MRLSGWQAVGSSECPFLSCIRNRAVVVVVEGTMS